VVARQKNPVVPASQRFLLPTVQILSVVLRPLTQFKKFTMADVAEENKVIDATAAPVEEVKEVVKEVVKEDAAAAGEVVAEAPAAVVEPVEKVEETKDVENGNSEEVPKENGTAKDENGTAENGSAEGEADAERKRKTEVADETDGTPAEGVSAEKKAKLEEKSEDGGVAETPSNGDQGVVV